MCLRSLFLLTVWCVLSVPALLLLTVSSGSVCFVSPIVLFINSLVRFVSPGAAFADSLVRIACRRLWKLSPGTSKTVPGFPRPEIVFAATFYKGFYKGFGTLPFSRNLASPAQVSPDGFRSFILLTVWGGNRMFCVSDRSFY